MRRISVVVGVLVLAGCPGDDGSGDTDTDSGTGTDTGGMSMTASPSTSTTATPTSSSSTTDAPTTDAPTTDAMTTDATTTDAMTTDAPTSTTGVDCDGCVEENCSREAAACLANPDCECWIDCIEAGGENCFMMCEGPPPDEFDPFVECIDNECGMECNGGGTGTGTGGGADGVYEECGNGMPCEGDLECNMFVNYCSVDCTGQMCPIPATGDAVPECSDFSDNCILPCDDGTTCPDGMTCQNLGPAQLCAF